MPVAEPRSLSLPEFCKPLLFLILQNLCQCASYLNAKRFKDMHASDHAPAMHDWHNMLRHAKLKEVSRAGYGVVNVECLCHVATALRRTVHLFAVATRLNMWRTSGCICDLMTVSWYLASVRRSWSCVVLSANYIPRNISSIERVTDLELHLRQHDMLFSAGWQTFELFSTSPSHCQFFTSRPELLAIFRDVFLILHSDAPGAFRTTMGTS